MTRLDEYTLVVSPEGGYLKPLGHRASPGDPALSVRYLVRHLDTLVRGPEHPLRLGERIELTLATIEITKATTDGRPAEATFRFHVPLEDPSLRWLYANLQGYAPFTPPAIGETVSVPSPLEPGTPVKASGGGQ